MNLFLRGAEKGIDQGFNSYGVSGLALPDDKDTPAKRLQFLVYLKIASHIFVQLVVPEIHV